MFNNTVSSRTANIGEMILRGVLEVIKFYKCQKDLKGHLCYSNIHSWHVLHEVKFFVLLYKLISLMEVLLSFHENAH